MKLTASIFDLNGTVVEDEDEWGEAFSKVLKTLGVNETDKYPHIPGIGVEENWPIFVRRYKLKTQKTTEQLAAETKKEYKRLIDRIELLDGFENFVEQLRESDVKTALATSSTWGGIEEILERFDLEKYFDVITTGEEVSRKKPDPEIFVITAEKLGVNADECLVLEDSHAGVVGSVSAGMKTIAIYRSKDHKKTLEEANLIVKDFKEITPEILTGI